MEWTGFISRNGRLEIGTSLALVGNGPLTVGAEVQLIAERAFYISTVHMKTCSILILSTCGRLWMLTPRQSEDEAPPKLRRRSGLRTEWWTVRCPLDH